MALDCVKNQCITDRFAIYNADCIDVLSKLAKDSIGMSVYSPPFAELYNYSSSERDLSNCRDYEEFLKHYDFVVREIARATQPGRLSCVHCMDLKRPGGELGLRDFPGDIIRIHERNGFHFHARTVIWKEPLRVAIRTRLLGLRHGQLVKDSSLCHVAGGDFLLVFRKAGENRHPIQHPIGLKTYAGETEVPQDLLAKFSGEWDDQRTNRLSHWIWRRYASCVWDDIRIGRVLPYKKARESEEEKHICPLQLDVVERCLTLWSNEGDVVLTPFMGIGTEVYCSVLMRRRGVGIELKESYYRQAEKNVSRAVECPIEEKGLYDDEELGDPVDVLEAEEPEPVEVDAE